MKKMSFLQCYRCPSSAIPQGVVYSYSLCSSVALAARVQQHEERNKELGGLRLTCEAPVHSPPPLHVVSVRLVVVL